MTLERKLLVATGNPKKGREMQEILSDLGLEILTFADFPGVPTEVEETGGTYQANATLKAVAACEHTGLVCISDDAGLEIDALGGRPGVDTKFFLGEHRPFPDKMDELLGLLANVPDSERGCRYNCSIVIAAPGRVPVHCQGICEGRIGHARRGAFGFGYDPIFLIPELGLHMAELPPAQKHEISHRGQAMRLARMALGELFG